jgi:hypothetical protein
MPSTNSGRQARWKAITALPNAFNAYTVEESLADLARRYGPTEAERIRTDAIAAATVLAPPGSRARAHGGRDETNAAPAARIRSLGESLDS